LINNQYLATSNMVHCLFSRGNVLEASFDLSIEFRRDDLLFVRVPLNWSCVFDYSALLVFRSPFSELW